MSQLAPTTHVPELEPFIHSQIFGVSEIHTAHTLVASTHPTPATASFLDYFTLAIATWAPINGHVCVDLADVRSQVRAEMSSLDNAESQDAFDALVWPTFDELLAHLSSSPLVHTDAVTSHEVVVDYTKPLVLSGDLLYLTRQFVDEVSTAHAIGQRFAAQSSEMPVQTEQWIREVFKDEHAGLQADAVRNVLRFPTSVLLGGPGTGKTYTIAGMLHALLAKHSTQQPTQPLRIALAAPTAKAAQQMTMSITSTLSATDDHGNHKFPQQHREEISNICSTSSTIHRLLGWVPNNRARFQHNHHRPLPFDVVIIDEVSMISLPLMARLLEALSPQATLVLVGDPAQLQSVEAGAVLPQIAYLAEQSTFPIVTLQANWRQRKTPKSEGDNKQSDDGNATQLKLNDIGSLAELMRIPVSATESEEDAAARAVVDFLQTSHDDITFIELPVAKNQSSSTTHIPDPTTQNIRDALAPHLVGFTTAAQYAKQGDVEGALAALSTVRVLCAHREGKYGVATWNTLVADIAHVGRQRGSVGQPLLNTRNDIKTGLVNGDTSIVVQLGASRRAAFPPHASQKNNANSPDIRLFAPSTLDDADIAFAMTVHKAQGSQYDTVVVIVPPVGSPLLQREMLYTAVTRARRHLVVVATSDSVEVAMKTSIRRISGLADRITHPRPIKQ